MKKYLRLFSLVLSVWLLLTIAGCGRDHSTGTTVATHTNPSNTEPSSTTKIPMQPTSLPTRPGTEPTTAPTAPSTEPTNPETAEGRIAVVIVIDTSASMAGDRLEAAIKGAKAYVNAMNDWDFCGVLALSFAIREELEVLPVYQRELIVEMIEEIAVSEPYGPIIFTSSIILAGRALSDIVNVERKHVVMITDSNSGDTYDVYLPYIEDNVKNNITMSVVSIDTPLVRQEQMQNTADVGGGRYYNVKEEDLGNLAEIMLEDLAEIRKSISDNP